LALFGGDSTTGIVSVDADAHGRARVWRRVASGVECTEHQFPNWFLTTSLDLLDHLSARRLSAEWLRSAHGQVSVGDQLCVVDLDGPAVADADSYRYLVLTTDLDEVETALVETVNKRDGGDALSLADLRGLVLMWHPIEQFLTLSGRTYFKGLAYDAIHRLQFDLETTGLNEERDRIFMISMRDSTGWRDCLDTTSMSEAQLLERFVRNVQERDPDTLENHNIFGFDLPFLVKRAGRLGVHLGLGRDGSEPWLETDVFDSGERPEPFLRWRIVGREVIDTQHAVRHFGVNAPDMRRHGLKEAARYFGLARADREYVPGPEIWSTFGTDPERIRRYAADDVDEVDGLSRRLMPATFALATMLPRAYERIAADNGAGSLWELLLVRAYLTRARAITAPAPRLQRPGLTLLSELFIKGVVGRSVRADVHSLLPSVLASESIVPPNDDLGVLPRLVARLLRQPDHEGARLLAAAAPVYLASQGLFSDPGAATDATAGARLYVDRFLRDVRQRGGLIVAVDGEQVIFGEPPGWDEPAARDLAQAASGYLPPGVRVVYVANYEAMYARAPATSITLDRDGAVTLVGPAFRPGRLERFGDRFMHRAAACVLLGDIPGLRRVFIETVTELRLGELPLEDLCVHVTLHKSPVQYRRGGTHEEPYEVLLGAGVRSWRVGQRIRYFHARGGEPRLHQEGQALTAAEADSDYYVQRLSGLYCQQFAQAFRREDFARIFRLPQSTDPDPPELLAELAEIHPIAEPLSL
jgi:hypothetical protein